MPLVENLKIRSLRPEDDRLLHKWLTDPRVLFYYEGRDKPHDMNMIHERFLTKVGDNTVKGNLVLWNGTAIGYIQTYPVIGEELASYGYLPTELIYGMDQFLGEPDFWNHGIGTVLVSTMTRWLITEYGAERIVMDPRIENARAIHVYEKCRFKKIKILPQHELHEGQYHDCWLMEYQTEP